MLALVSASDAVMLGMIDQDSLSAASLAGQIQFVLSLFLAAMTIGTSMFAAQYWGKGDRAAVERLFAGVMGVTAVISLLFFLAAELIPEALMVIFTTDEILIAGGKTYLRTVGPSYLFCGISQIYLCILKNSEQAGKSTMISSAAVLINIGLNAVFIFGLLGAPEMGIAGAALATVLARAAELIWVILESLKKDRIHLRISSVIHTDGSLMRDFWKYTAPVLGNELVWGCGFTMYSVIMGHLGSDAVAANSITTIVKNLIACFCLGLGSGGGIMVGNELGAGRLEQAKEYGGRLCRLSIGAGIITGLFLLAASPFVLKVTNLSGQAEHYLKWMLVLCAVYMTGKSVNSTVIGGIFCAGGDSKFGFLCDAAVMWGITVPLGLIAAFGLDLPVLAVYLIVNMDEMIKMPAVYRHYRKYKWVKDLTAGEEQP